MKKLLLLLTFIGAGYFIFTAQDTPVQNVNQEQVMHLEGEAIINPFVQANWYRERGLEPPQYIYTPIAPYQIQYSELDLIDGPDITVFPSLNPQSENSIAVNQMNPTQVFISTNGRIPGSNPVVQQTWFFSSNSGLNWFGSEDLPPTEGNNSYGDPVALFDRNNRAYFVTLGQSGGVRIGYTTNLGTTWGTFTNADPNNSFSDDKEHAMTDLSGVFPNNVYCAWTDFAVSPNPIQFTYSTNNGSTWSSRRTLLIPGARGQGCDIATGPNGNVYVAWAHYPGTTAEAGIGFAKSTDGGNTFNTPVVAFPIVGIRVSNGGIPAFNGTRANSFPDIDVDRSGGARNGWIYIVYPDRNTGDADIYMNKSTDQGATWGTQIRVNGDPVSNGKQQWMSSIAVDAVNGNLYVSYYNMDSTGFLTSRWLAISTDGGSTWDRGKISDIRFTPQPLYCPNMNTVYMGDYYQTAGYNNRVYPCWSDNRLPPGTCNYWKAYISPINVTPPPPPLSQPDQWCANYPAIPGSGVLWGHASVALNDTVYVAGGSSTGAPSTTMYKYAISSNTWTTGASLPGPKSGGDLASAGGKIYYIGGGNTAVTIGTPEQYVYNPATGTWSTIANIPTPVTGNVAEVYRDTIIYCMMGGWTSYLTTVQVYYTGSNTWTTATSLPGGAGRRTFAGGILGNNLFAACGYSATFRQDFYRGVISLSDPTLITWTLGPQTALASSRPGGTAVNGRFYVVFGELSGGGASDSIGIYDTTSNSWSYVDGKPNRTSNLWGAVSATYVTCNNIAGIKIWVPGGALGLQTNRPLDVFADTCLTSCTYVGIAGNSNIIPKDYVLSQNYPNPFNPVTKISYSIPNNENIKLIVYDLLGREVAVLVNEFKHAGKYSVEFNGQNLASGVYFYRLQAGDFMDVKKMILVK